MQCPKCGYLQDESPKCDSCGVYFAKYQKRQEMLEEAPPEIDTRKRAFLLIALGVGVLVGLIVTITLMSNDVPDVVASGGESLSNEPTVVGEAPEGVHPSEWLYSKDIASQLRDDLPARNAVELARMSTVYIEAPWGSGSGFFASPECNIVTNAHVVKFDEKKLSRASRVLATEEARLSTTAAQLSQLENSVEIKRAMFLRGCSDCSEARYYREVGKYEQETLRLRSQIQLAASNLEARRQILRDFEYANYFKIILANGDQLEAELVRISDRYDLALLKLVGATCPYLRPANEDEIRYGDPVFALGSPQQIKHVVTAGVLSGYQNARGSRWIQTDAAINPGNSGGPLIDASGRVLGINTLKLAGAEGIGWAIPFSIAQEEFGL
jgi:serine protease Do